MINNALKVNYQRSLKIILALKWLNDQIGPMIYWFDCDWIAADCIELFMLWAILNFF